MVAFEQTGLLEPRQRAMGCGQTDAPVLVEQQAMNVIGGEAARCGFFRTARVSSGAGKMAFRPMRCRTVDLPGWA